MVRQTGPQVGRLGRRHGATRTSTVATGPGPQDTISDDARPAGTLLDGGFA